MATHHLGPQADRLSDRIRLHRQARPDTPIVIVEGGPDKRFVERLLGASHTLDIFPAGPRPELFRAAREAREMGIDRLACIVDRDFDDAVDRHRNDGLPLVAYDGADLEGMLWSTEAYDEWLSEIANEVKLAAFGGVAALREKITDSLLPLQRLRSANAHNGWGLVFDSLDLRKKASKEDLSIKLQVLCDSVWHTDAGPTKNDVFEAAISFEVPTCPATGHPLLRGKDAIALTAVALRRLVGSLTLQATNLEQLEAGLRLAANETHLRGSPWLHEAVAFLDGR